LNQRKRWLWNPIEDEEEKEKEEEDPVLNDNNKDNEEVKLHPRHPRIPFLKGFLSFAGFSNHTRDTQLFVALSALSTTTAASKTASKTAAAASFGHQPWERPIGSLFMQENPASSSSSSLEHIYTGYGDFPSQGGNGPVQEVKNKIYERS
jgi:hypothetical protein